MNIHDFDAPETIPGTWEEIVAAIFDKQRELMVRYKEIERLPDAPVSVHHASGQKVLKDFAWRTVEELAESYEALENYAIHHTEDHIDHMREELADSLHFLVELLIFAGIAPKQCSDAPEYDIPTRDYRTAYWSATYEMGRAMNFLRNKPWKKTQVPTDEARFRAQLILAWRAHVSCWLTAGLHGSDVYSYYFRKHQVNKFRQRSNY